MWWHWGENNLNINLILMSELANINTFIDQKIVIGTDIGFCYF
jgi:hypothetical protein